MQGINTAKPTSRLTFVHLALAAILGLALGQQPCHASEALNDELAAMAKVMAKILSARDHDSVAIGQFTGPPTFPTSAGPGIQKILSEELEKAEITVKSRAPMGIEGKYRVVTNEVPVQGNSAVQQQLVAMRISAAIIDREGRALTELVSPVIDDVKLESDGTIQVDVQDEQTVLELTGVPAELDPAAVSDAEDRSQVIQQSLDEPPADLIDETRVTASSTSPYAMEVLVDGIARTPTSQDGLPFVQLNQGETYEIRLLNNSPYDAAVRLSIDGLNTFSFSDLKHESGEQKGQLRYDSWIVPSSKSVVVRGWHRTNSLADAFRITDYGDSAAASLNQTSNVGTISAIFSAAWEKDLPPPEDEPGTAKNGTGGSATGFGPPIDVTVSEVEREIGTVRASISVRYTK